MLAPTESEGESLSPHPPPLRPHERLFREGKSVLQRIGWRRPSDDERRWWVVQGVVILGAVLLIGALMFLALR